MPSFETESKGLRSFFGLFSLFNLLFFRGAVRERTNSGFAFCRRGSADVLPDKIVNLLDALHQQTETLNKPCVKRAEHEFPLESL